MKTFRLVAVSAFSLIAAAQALAADLPTRQAPPSPPSPYGELKAQVAWTGFYIGGNLGDAYLSGSYNSAWSSAQLRNQAFHIGLYAGYNYQIAPQIVVGGEANYGWAAQNSQVIPVTVNQNLASFARNEEALRARAGYLVLPNVMLYGTAGLAIAQQSLQLTRYGAATNYVGYTLAESPNRFGFTLGAGVEYQLMPNVLTRVDYRYNNYGSINENFNGLQAGGTTSLRTQSVDVGAAYRF